MHRVHIYHSQREGLSVGQLSSSVSERTGQRILAVKKHEFHADYDRRSARELGEIIESQREELTSLRLS